MCSLAGSCYRLAGRALPVSAGTVRPHKPPPHRKKIQPRPSHPLGFHTKPSVGTAIGCGLKLAAPPRRRHGALCPRQPFPNPIASGRASRIIDINAEVVHAIENIPESAITTVIAFDAPGSGSVP